MATVNVYLNFNGNCKEAFEFYKSVLGGEFSYFSQFKDMPPGSPVAPEDAEKVMHVSLPMGEGTILMGSDTSQMSGEASFGTNFSLSVCPDSRAESERIFVGLSQGGKVVMPLADTFWGAYFGFFTDKFGINWMINYEEKK